VAAVCCVSISGAEGNRTPDLCSAIAALSQLSYGPLNFEVTGYRGQVTAFDCTRDRLLYPVTYNLYPVFPVGGTRLELVTSTMSTWRSNQLS
jgi:hypothetical protein